MVEENFHKKTTQPGSTQKKPTQFPEKIGPYNIEGIIGTGGMSILYLANHPDTKKPLAIKVLSEKFLKKTNIVQHFLNESEIISMTDHPNIVKLFGHGEWEEGLYIAMEFIEGITLREYVLRNPISLKKALEMILDISYAICHLHTHGVIHRDIKPGNILITNSGQIKVIDFGVAQLLTEQPHPSDKPKRIILGTPFYMSPEQKDNPDLASFPSDIFSLGIIGYELILGKMSHGRIHLGLIPKGIRKILRKALQPKPEDRYPDIVDFISDISNYLNSPEMESEKKAGDELSELSENLVRVQSSLIPQKKPDWSDIDMGISSHKGLSSVGIYYDFFELPDKHYGIFLAETSTKGPEGIIYISFLRGIIHTLCRQQTHPVEMIKLLNDIIIDDQLEPVFVVSYVTLSPATNLLHFISCGYRNLWLVNSESKDVEKISTKNIALGINPHAEFQEVTKTWNIGDTIFLNTYATHSQHQESSLPKGFFKQGILDNLDVSPQEQTENILRKTLTLSAESQKKRPLTVISIKRIR